MKEHPESKDRMDSRILWGYTGGRARETLARMKFSPDAYFFGSDCRGLVPVTRQEAEKIIDDSRRAEPVRYGWRSHDA